MAVQLDDDLYAHLGVAPSATVDEIAAAFRARAKELHPDRHPGDAATAERFKVLTHAYGVLTDPARRSAYDRRRTTPAPTPAATARGTTHQPVFGTTRSARIGLWSGVALLALGIASGVVLSAVDTGDAPKAITLWLITAKLVICGAILWAVAAWRLHRLKARAVPTQR